MNFLSSKKKKIFSVVFLGIIFVSYFFDKGLSIGLIILLLLSVATFFVMNKMGIKDKKIYYLFIIAFSIHLFAALFMHYANFQPFSGGGGDYIMYQKQAVSISEGFRKGNFSIQNIISEHSDELAVGNYYPVIIGCIYALTFPSLIMGLIFNVWIASVTAVIIYLLVSEIGGSERNAFIIGLISTIYPSYIFISGLLLKDTLEIFFIMLGLLLLVKMVKNFKWYNFLGFYLAVVAATHFRFYIGYALMVTFLGCWVIFSKMNIKRKIIYAAVFIILLGFVPQFSAGQGYFGYNSFKQYLNSKSVNFYRKLAYAPQQTNVPSVRQPSGAGAKVGISPNNNEPEIKDKADNVLLPNPNATVGLDSTFVSESTPLGYAKSFIYVLLGPFPWQIKNLRQALALFETIPWYILLFFVADGLIISFKKRNKEVIPLLVFSIIVITVIAIFDTNFGIITRIRMPAFISLLCIAALGFNENNIIYSFLYNFYNKSVKQLFKKNLWQNTWLLAGPGLSGAT